MGNDLSTNGKTRKEAASIALIGCGAVSELSHGPALAVVERMKLARVDYLIDPSPARREKLLEFFPEAKALDGIAQLDKVDIALVATPPGNHSEVVEKMAAKKIAMLCEKPISVSAEDAERIVDSTERAGVFCSIGQFRRWFPAVRTIRSLITGGTLGKLASVRGFEGGLFRWPVASAAIFTKSQSGGGITMDIGIHALDLMRLWLGDVKVSDYADDAEGGVEINAIARLSSPTCSNVSLRMSWDWKLPNFYEFKFEKARVRWPTNSATRVLINVNGADHWIDGSVVEDGASDWNPVGPVSTSHTAAFTQQWVDVISAVRSDLPPPVPPSDAAKSLGLVLACYKVKRPLGRPWADVPTAKAVTL